MGTAGAGGLGTDAIEACIERWECDTQDDAVAARAELAALVEAAGRAGALAAALGLARDTFTALRWGLQDEFWPGRAVSAEDGLAMFRLLDQAARGVGDALADAGRGAAGARDEPALLDAAARYQDAWRVLAAGDVDDGAKIGHILDMHEAREDLFDATEVALRAGGAGEEARWPWR